MEVQTSKPTASTTTKGGLLSWQSFANEHMEESLWAWRQRNGVQVHVHDSLAGETEQARSHDIDSCRAVVKTKSHVNKWPGKVPGTRQALNKRQMRLAGSGVHKCSVPDQKHGRRHSQEDWQVPLLGLIPQVMWAFTQS